MPLYNAERFVVEAIESIIVQTYQNWELIIVNDGSTDNSLAVAKLFENDKIKIFTKVNSGAAASRNFGYKHSVGKNIKFFDADDIINPKILEEQAKLAIKYPKSIISGKWGRFYKDDLSTFKLSPEECWQDMQPVDWICSSWKNGQCMTQPGIFLIPKSIIEKAGLWDERLSLIDDFEFFTRVILASENIKFSDASCLYYRSGISGTLSSQKTRKAAESAYLSGSLGIEYLLQKKNTIETKKICANLLMNLVYEYYTQYPDITLKLEKKIKELGGSNLKYSSNRWMRIISKLINWKVLEKIKKCLRNCKKKS